MTAPNPREVRDDLKAIARLLSPVADEYAWAFHYAYGKAGRGDFDGGTRPGHSDPTGDHVAGWTCPVEGCDDRDGECGHAEIDPRTVVREMLEKNAQDVEDARRALERARRRMKRFRYTAFDVTGLPDPGQSISKAEVAEAREAKARRDARGEGFGA